MKVLVTGALGNVGEYTVRALVDEGHEVVAFDIESRKARKVAAQVDPRVRVVWGDITKPASLGSALEGVDAVVHLAAIVAPEKAPDLARCVNVDATRNLIEQMETHPTAKRLVFASSQGIFGDVQDRDPPLRIDTPLSPTNDYGRHKVACEQAIRESRLRWTVLRLAVAPPTRLLGYPYDPSYMFEFSANARFEFIHPADAGTAFGRAVACEDAIGKVLYLGGGETCQLTHFEFSNEIMHGIGIGPLPADAFVRTEVPRLFGDWVDTEESERLLHYQKRDLSDLTADMRKDLGAAVPLIRLLRPVVTWFLVRQSPYLKENRQGGREGRIEPRRVVSMNADELIRAAQERTNLEHFDSDSFREPLDSIVAEIDARPERDTIANALRNEMTNALANRLRVTDYLRRHPELEDAPLDVPVIVMGMPRTGTTVLSYLLDCDPRWRSLLNWEAVDSVPPPTTATLRTDPRCVAKKEIQEKILPNIPFAVPHWEWADGPTECIFVHAQDFKALSWEARLASRTYADYLLDCDMSTAYDYQKKVMRVLQSRAPGRWALKMPSHSLHFRWALEAFPDARFLWSHRNPYRALASLGTTISMGHRVALGHVDEEFIHDVYPHQIAEHANRPMRLRPSLPEDKILDVYCAEFLKDPISGMAGIYDWLGEDLTPAVEEAMRAWMAGDNERQAGRTGYSLEDFGWTEDELAPLFAEYLETYPKAREA